jgi:hypothetical protein
VPYKRGDVAGEVCLSALQRQQLGHHRALEGFDAQETSCNLNKIDRQGTAWLASFSCSSAGLSWLEDDEIRVSKNGWTLQAKIKNVRRVGDLIRSVVEG